MKVFPRVLAGIALVCALSPAIAQDFPTKPIRLIVPFPPGGGTDTLARELASQVAKDTGWSLITENRPGSGGNIGVDAVVKSAPDGYTLALGQTSNLAINPTLYAKLPYDPEKDLTPIGLIASAPLVLAVSAQSPYKTLADMLNDAKAKPGALNYGSSGSGTVSHLATVKLQQATGVTLTHIPYKGAAQGVTDVIGGQIEMYMSSVPTLIGHIHNGKMRGLVVTSLKRTQDLPDVPSVAESGYKDFEAITWFGIAGPAGVPQNIVDKLNAAFNHALKTENLQKKYREQGADVLTSTPAEFGKLIHNDRLRWADIVKASGARVE